MSMIDLLSSEGQDRRADLRQHVPDCTQFPQRYTLRQRALLLAAAVLIGAGGAWLVMQQMSPRGAALGLLAGLAFAGGLLSTWSPCGYSSLCLLRPVGRYSASSLLRWTPTFIVHGLGYALGAVILGTVLGFIGNLIGGHGPTSGVLMGLGLGGLIYGAHQLGFVRVPYPQRRAQVPHDARQRFSMWAVGAIYGVSLGMNYLTYVQTPILYLVTAAALLSGNVVEGVAIFALFNLGRFLPMAVNYLPVSDMAVQNWLARHQENAAVMDGVLLVGAGSAMIAFLIA